MVQLVIVSEPATILKVLDDIETYNLEPPVPFHNGCKFSAVFAGEQIGAMVRPFGIPLEKADHLLYMMRDD